MAARQAVTRVRISIRTHFEKILLAKVKLIIFFSLNWLLSTSAYIVAAQLDIMTGELHTSIILQHEWKLQCLKVKKYFSALVINSFLFGHPGGKKFL